MLASSVYDYLSILSILFALKVYKLDHIMPQLDRKQILTVSWLGLMSSTKYRLTGMLVARIYHGRIWSELMHAITSNVRHRFSWCKNVKNTNSLWFLDRLLISFWCLLQACSHMLQVFVMFLCLFAALCCLFLYCR